MKRGGRKESEVAGRQGKLTGGGCSLIPAAQEQHRHPGCRTTIMSGPTNVLYGGSSSNNNNSGGGGGGSPLSSRGGSPILCQRCGQVCRGEVVRVKNTHFHVHCFTCQVCSCDLVHSGFFCHSGEYICTEDYQRLYGTQCDSCGQYISGEVVSALGRTYHPHCFVCSMCRRPFPIGDRVTFCGKKCVCQQCSHTLSTNKPVKVHGPSSTCTRADSEPPPPPPPLPSPPQVILQPRSGSSICSTARRKQQSCFHSSLSSPVFCCVADCAGCGQEIKQGQSLLALERQWHVTCFKCRQCGCALTGEYISKDGIPYCEADYHARFGIRCDTCSTFISGRVLEAGGKRYHPSCARCARCHMMFLEGEEMYLTGSEVWHPMCKEAARLERKLRQLRRGSETPSISSPGSSPLLGSPHRLTCLAALPRVKALYNVQQPDIIPYQADNAHTLLSDGSLRYKCGQDLLDGVDLRARRPSGSAHTSSPAHHGGGSSPLHCYLPGSESGRSSPYYSQPQPRCATPIARVPPPRHFHVPDTFTRWLPTGRRNYTWNKCQGSFGEMSHLASRLPSPPRTPTSTGSRPSTGDKT
ncbi:actin-binding LIM protein 3-like isoform X1 [Nelusetta ayraudi]|uniref:actin-binding LIM protein 3-like isoform X1 n=1 Tax=Nelusetta ayraudi TaxID=303726 RepID=UPI003F720882